MINEQYGKKANSAIEQFFAHLAHLLGKAGFGQFIVAGGETSGAVVKALDIEGFYIGRKIAANVPWLHDLSERFSLVLKSGNFGDENVFEKAQRFYHE